MRIIGGKAKGIPLRGRRTRFLRPTPGVVRESLFSILGEKVKGASFLDLYAGVGSVGVEALSRGADRAVFVETRKELTKLIQRNLEAGGFVDQAQVLHADVKQALRKMLLIGEKFQFVFVDPPYYTNLKEILELMKGVLFPEGLLILQHSKQTPPPEVNEMQLLESRHFGDTVISLYCHEDSEGG